MSLLHCHTRDITDMKEGSIFRFCRILFRRSLWYWVMVYLLAPAVSVALQPYPQSTVILDKDDQVSGFWLILGQLRKVNGELRPEYQEFKMGTFQRHRIIHRIPEGHSSRKAFDFIKSQLSGTVLFECEKRRCGPSNFWANDIFNQYRLNGPDRGQYYQVVESRKNGVYTITLIYTIERGNKNVYAYVETLTQESISDTDSVSTEQSLTDQLVEQGWGLLLDENFTDEHRLEEKDEQTLLSLLSTVLSDDKLKTSSWVLVVHKNNADGDDDASTLKITEQRAEYLQRVVVEAFPNVSVSAFGVGALVPQISNKLSNGVFLIRR